MMTASVLIAAAAWVIRPNFVSSFSFRISFSQHNRLTLRLFASDPAQLASLVESRVSRLSTLQSLLYKFGAPGSQGCTQRNDLMPVVRAGALPQDTPELVASMSAAPSFGSSREKFKNLHPYLLPISQSDATGNLVCAYRNPSHEGHSQSTVANPKPWAIVEAKVGGPGVNFLALNSEHLMRRIVCKLDFEGTNPDAIALYNEGLGLGTLTEASLETPYEPGSVAKLGYGVEKYVLLRVGPFADLYEQMARQHYARGDESSALIAAETANGKLSGFASTFRFYARLLSSFPHRAEEVRDAARMCLRMSLPTIGMDIVDFEEVAMLGNMSAEFDSPEIALQKLGDMYRLMQSVEKDDEKIVKTPVEKALDEANNLINDAVLHQQEWSSIRTDLASIFRLIGRDEMAAFVDL
jgi:hypothetical protein